MDPRQRAVDRRRSTKIAVFFGIGATSVVLGLLLSLVVADSVEFHDSGGYRRGGSWAAYFVLMVAFGVVMMLIAVGDLFVRWVKGPQKPGKRARN